MSSTSFSFVSDCAVASSTGKIDVQATLAKFNTMLQTHIAERELEEGEIARVVSDIFDGVKTTRVNMPYVIGKALAALNVQPENHAALTEKVQSYLRANAQGKVTITGEGKNKVRTEERPTSLLVIGKGKLGGIGRRADLDAARLAALNAEHEAKGAKE